MQSRVSGAVSLTLAQAVLLILGWVTHPLIGRLLGTASYGIYGVVLSVQSIIGLFLTLGVPMAISRYVAQDPRHAKSTLWQGLRIQVSLALIISTTTFLISPFIAKSLGDPSLANYFRFISLIIFLQAGYPIFIQYFSGLHLFNKQALLTTIYAVIKLGSAISLIFIFNIIFNNFTNIFFTNRMEKGKARTDIYKSLFRKRCTGTDLFKRMGWMELAKKTFSFYSWDSICSHKSSFRKFSIYSTGRLFFLDRTSFSLPW